jgi:1-acyl-sn-glycerol-3-phosphate acyltransferase
MPAKRTRTRLYFMVRVVARFLFTVLTNWQVSGQENVPERGPYLVIANHLGTFDPPLIMAALPVPIMVFAASTHRHDFFIGPLMNHVGAIWVRRGEVDREALRAALQVLEAGGIMGVAPEGTRSKTGTLQEGKIGAAYLATRAGVPLLPVALTGTEDAGDKLRHLRRPTLTATIGKPFRLPKSGHVSMAELQAYTDQIMHVLAEMLPEKYRGVYT